jgi:hypothetical protein
MAVGFIAALLGLIAGAAIVMKLWLAAPVSSAMAVVDLAGIVERQRTDVLKQAKDLETADRIISERMIQLASILAELGQERVILNKPAVVSGKLPDLTAQVEEQLSGEGLNK